MIDLSMLSLNDITPIQDTGYNCILDCKTIEDLLYYIYSFENPNISFEELHDKIIDYYILEANDECISNHLISVKNHINTFYDDDNKLNIIINFISSPYGTEYLKSIFNTIKY